MKILEIGAGTGVLAAILTASGYTVIGTDFFPSAVETANSRIANGRYTYEEGGVRFEVGDRLLFKLADATILTGYESKEGALYEGFENDGFDFVILNEGIGNVPISHRQAEKMENRGGKAVNPVFHEFAQVLKEGGSLVMHDYGEAPSGKTYQDDVGYIHYSLAARRKALAEAFKVEDPDQIQFLPLSSSTPGETRQTYGVVVSKGARAEARVAPVSDDELSKLFTLEERERIENMFKTLDIQGATPEEEQMIRAELRQALVDFKRQVVSNEIFGQVFDGWIPLPKIIGVRDLPSHIFAQANVRTGEITLNGTIVRAATDGEDTAKRAEARRMVRGKLLHESTHVSDEFTELFEALSREFISRGEVRLQPKYAKIVRFLEEVIANLAESVEGSNATFETLEEHLLGASPILTEDIIHELQKPWGLILIGEVQKLIDPSRIQTKPEFIISIRGGEEYGTAMDLLNRKAIPDDRVISLYMNGTQIPPRVRSEFRMYLGYLDDPEDRYLIGSSVHDMVNAFGPLVGDAETIQILFNELGIHSRSGGYGIDLDRSAILAIARWLDEARVSQKLKVAA